MPRGQKKNIKKKKLLCAAIALALTSCPLLSIFGFFIVSKMFSCFCLSTFFNSDKTTHFFYHLCNIFLYISCIFRFRSGTIIRKKCSWHCVPIFYHWRQFWLPMSGRLCNFYHHDSSSFEILAFFKILYSYYYRRLLLLQSLFLYKIYPGIFTDSVNIYK